MEKIRLGRTGLMVSRTGFGGIPIQRINKEESKKLLLHAYEGGINYFDTAAAYSDSEEKFGDAFSQIRDKVIIATKSLAKDRKKLIADAEQSLRAMKTDYIDVYQMHNPAEIYPDVYEAILELKQQGKVRVIGVTSHDRVKAQAYIKSGYFDTMQFPLTFLSTPEDLQIINICKEHDVGLLGMKGLAGGLINNAKCAFTFLRQYQNIVPLWGIEKMHELDEFLSYEKNPPVLDDEIQKQIDAFCEELQGNFCRTCGYCMPCTVGINIPTAAKLVTLLKRSRSDNFITDKFADDMAKVDNCTNCGRCKKKCPYGIDIPNLIRSQYSQYKIIRKELLSEK